MLLCLACSPTWAQGAPDTAAARYGIDAAPRTLHACKAIAALANHGARALQAADLLGRDMPIDLRNDGHPEKIVRLEQGTAHAPFLAKEDSQPIYDYGRADYFEVARWAYEIVVLRVEERTWKVDWNTTALDDVAVLVAATDGNAICRFHDLFQPPVFRRLAGGERGKEDTYRALLLGHGVAPPSAGLDAKAVNAASGLGRDTSHFYSVGSPSWRVDLLNNGQPKSLIRIELISGAGRGCDRYSLGVVEDGRLTTINLLSPYRDGWGKDGGKIVPLSQALNQLLEPLACEGVAETPVIGRDGRTYVLLDDERQVRLLVGARNGVMQPLARLFWQRRNEVLPPFKP